MQAKPFSPFLLSSSCLLLCSYRQFSQGNTAGFPPPSFPRQTKPGVGHDLWSQVALGSNPNSATHELSFNYHQSCYFVRLLDYKMGCQQHLPTGVLRTKGGEVMVVLSQCENFGERLAQVCGERQLLRHGSWFFPLWFCILICQLSFRFVIQQII